MSWLLATTSHRKLLSCQPFGGWGTQFHRFPCRGGARLGRTPGQGDLGQTLLLPRQEQRWLRCRTACGGLCASRVLPARQTQWLSSEKAPLGCRVHGASSDPSFGKGGLRLCSQWGTRSHHLRSVKSVCSGLNLVISSLMVILSMWLSESGDICPEDEQQLKACENGVMKSAGGDFWTQWLYLGDLAGSRRCCALCWIHSSV